MPADTWGMRFQLKSPHRLLIPSPPLLSYYAHLLPVQSPFLPLIHYNGLGLAWMDGADGLQAQRSKTEVCWRVRVRLDGQYDGEKGE